MNNQKNKEDRLSLRTLCVKVIQEKEDLKFKGTICKTPPIRIHVSNENTKWTKIIKALIKYVNEHLKMSDIKKIETVKGKDKNVINGDKLDFIINVNKINDFDEIIIYM